MGQRFVAIWFRYLVTDWFALRKPVLKQQPFVVSAPSQGRMVIAAANEQATAAGVYPGMVLADAKAVIHELQVATAIPLLESRLLRKLAEWCIRFTPVASIDLPDGLLLDVTGCSQLWGGDAAYLQHIRLRLQERGYTVHLAMADTVGAARGMARYGPCVSIFPAGSFPQAFLQLPAAALGISTEQVAQLYKLGLRRVHDFAGMPRSVLLRRFGNSFLHKLDEMTGKRPVILEPVLKTEPFEERLYCLEVISSRTSINIALEKLLASLCKRLQQVAQGIRAVEFTGYKTDSSKTSVSIGTHRPSYNPVHLSKLFDSKLDHMEPEPGIELFVLTATRVEPLEAAQEKLWQASVHIKSEVIGEFLDRVENKIGKGSIYRFVPAEHYWPERSFTVAPSFDTVNALPWQPNLQRPLFLLPKPEVIIVTAPVPDYPPMLFRYKDKVHKIVRADGPERIEPEWWLEDGAHRDYYCVEDESGNRYWLFRSGHYRGDQRNQWFLHGFFS